MLFYRMLGNYCWILQLVVQVCLLLHIILRVDIEVFCSEDAQDLVQVPDPPEVERGPVVAHLVPRLREGDGDEV